MKKTRFLLLLLALALLLSFAACGRDKDDTPSAPVEGNGAETGKLPGTAPGAEGTPFTGVGTQEEADAHLLEKGYPLGFTLRFTGGNKGLDTAAQECFDGSTSISRDFTPRLASIYNYMLEHDIIAMTQDLTYKAFEGHRSHRRKYALYSHLHQQRHLLYLPHRLCRHSGVQHHRCTAESNRRQDTEHG